MMSESRERDSRSDTPLSLRLSRPTRTRARYSFSFLWVVMTKVSQVVSFRFVRWLIQQSIAKDHPVAFCLHETTPSRRRTPRQPHAPSTASFRCLRDPHALVGRRMSNREDFSTSNQWFLPRKQLKHLAVCHPGSSHPEPRTPMGIYTSPLWENEQTMSGVFLPCPPPRQERQSTSACGFAQWFSRSARRNLFHPIEGSFPIPGKHHYRERREATDEDLSILQARVAIPLFSGTSRQGIQQAFWRCWMA